MVKYFDINENGHSIRCKLFCNNARDIKDVVICGHGFAGHKDNKSTERFAEAVLSKFKDDAVLIFDWPSHGKDVKKKILLSDCDEYLSLVIEYVKSTYGVSKIKGYANSFGGYVFLKYINEHGNPFYKLVLRSPAINIYESLMENIISNGEMELINKGKVAEVGFDRKTNVSKEFLDEVKAFDVREKEYLDEFEKILIIHGTKDEIIPYEVVEEFSDNNLIELIPFEGENHRFQNYAAMGNAIKTVIEFLELK